MVGAGRATGAAAFGLRLFPRASQAWLYRATSPEPALSSRLKHLSLPQIPVRSLCEKFFLSQSWSLFFVFSLLGFWRQASSIQQMPVLTGSRCPGGGLDSEFILTVNIHCLCPVPVPVCLLLFSSVPGSTGVCGCWIQVQRGVQQPEPRRPFWVSVPAPPHQYGGSGAGCWSGFVRTQAFPKSEPGLALPRHVA
jgi:hypothetical protein